MKRFLLYTLVVIKNATIVIPFIEGMISALVKMIEHDDQKKVQDKQKDEEKDESKDVKFEELNEVEND